MSRSARSFMSSARRHSTRRESSAERVAVVEVVVDHRREQVVGARDGVDVAGEVQVDVVGGDDLRAARRRCRRPSCRGRDPSEGSRSATAARARRARRAPGPGRSSVVVLPSPAGVGVIAETRTSLPRAARGRSAPRARSWP